MLSPRYYFIHHLLGNLALIRMDCLRFIKILCSKNIYSRTNRHGHITASGLVIKNDKVLLIRHPFIGKYFQPGGHIDENETPLEAAIREVYEETGWKCNPYRARNQILDVDIHLIPENKEKLESAHWHIDLCYQLNPIEQSLASENLFPEWIEISRVESPRVRRAFKKAMRLDQAANTSNNSVSS
jgi:8-oxo-dGTP pyrophosphatase MutT (NUDIX family)